MSHRRDSSSSSLSSPRRDGDDGNHEFVDVDRGDNGGDAHRNAPADSSAAVAAPFLPTPTGMETEPGRGDAAAAGSPDAASEKRRAIQAILRDASLTELERRLRIQRLMDGSSRPDYGEPGVGGAFAGAFCGAVGRGAGPRASGSSPALLVAGALRRSPGASATSSTIAGGGMGRGGEAAACVHYDRRCNVVAPCCGGVFGCRVCHDEMSPACGPMDRFAVKEVECKECGTRQGSKTNKCKKCGVNFAEYHCKKCNIWMALSKDPFHCDECGFCRVGGRENFKHCVQCMMCVSASVYTSHQCMAGKYKNNCPVCREDMFTSRQAPQDLPCGHAIHAHCFRNLAGFDYRCPICKKTVVSKTSMSAAWTARARDIADQPMPEDLAKFVDIMCNDCERKSEGLSWHFLGVQCPACTSFNTVVENVVSGGSGSVNSAGG